MAQIFKIQTEDPWDSIVIADGDQLAKGTLVYQGESDVLINGEKKKVSEKLWGGTYIVDGKSVEVSDGIIVSVEEMPNPVAAMKIKALKRKEEYKN